MMEYVHRSDRGKVRAVNEDYAIAGEIGGGYFLAAVADGMGGHRAGRVASRLLLKDIKGYMAEGLEELRDDDYADVVALFYRVLGRSIQDVYIMSQESEFWGMGTTLVASLIRGNDAIIVNIGDSRAYVFDGGLCRVTRDHSRVQRLLESGVIRSEEEAFTHPERNIVTRYVGMAEAVEYDTYRVRVGGVLLLCSDGLTDMLMDREIEAIMKMGEGLDETAELLIEAANRRGGRDNITVVLVRP